MSPATENFSAGESVKSAQQEASGFEYADPRTAAFRRTLDRLPDEIALAIGLRVFELGKVDACVCGWAVREALAREAGIDAESCEADDDAGQHSGWRAAEKFGGNYWDGWREIYWGVLEPATAPLIEEALFDRVMAASDALTTKRQPAQRPSPTPRKKGGGRDG